MRENKSEGEGECNLKLTGGEFFSEIKKEAYRLTDRQRYRDRHREC